MLLLLLAIRKQEEVLQESYMMIPDSKSRLEKAFEDLRDLLVNFDIAQLMTILL